MICRNKKGRSLEISPALVKRSDSRFMPEHGMLAHDRLEHDTQESGMRERDKPEHDMQGHDNWPHKILSFPPF